MIKMCSTYLSIKENVEHKTMKTITESDFIR